MQLINQITLDQAADILGVKPNKAIELLFKAKWLDVQDGLYLRFQIEALRDNLNYHSKRGAA